jgi:uncharacterized protein YdeI (YjbR/CyaY-like superfamily)
VDFSAVVLAVAATSQAFLEALSSASRDDMQLPTKHLQHKKGRESRIKKQRKALKTGKTQEKGLP